MVLGAKGSSRLSISSRPCWRPQSMRIRLPLISRQWQLPVTHWSAPKKLSFIVGPSLFDILHCSTMSSN